jgi:hypothetical protein
MVAPAGRALFFHAEAAPSAELDVEAKRCITHSVSQIIQLRRDKPLYCSPARDGVDEARASCRGFLGHAGGVPVCWRHCGPWQRRSVPYAVLSEPTWSCEAGSEQEGDWINGLSLSAVVMLGVGAGDTGRIINFH